MLEIYQQSFIFNFQLIYGIKIINPTIAAAIAHISTAPAAMSFTSPAIGCHSGDTKFTSRSIAVLNASAAITTPIQIIIATHSSFSISKIKPAIITNRAIVR